MDFEESTKASANQPNPSKLIRSQFKDVTVKVEDDVYYLDRLPLALKSGFFEKLFAEGKSDLIEIPQMNSKTFSAAVDVMYGESVGSVIDASAHANNFVSLLVAMDYLQMDIDTKICEYFVTRESNHIRSLNKDIFKLYDLITDNAKYEYWLPLVFNHLSDHLEKLKDCDELLSIKPDHFPKIISRRDRFESYRLDDMYHPFRMISKICARWICHDLENRSQHALELLNAARRRFSLSNKIAEEEFNLPLSSNNKHVDQNSISRYFCKWLTYSGEISRSKPVVTETSEDEQRYHEAASYKHKSMCGTYYDPPYVLRSEPKLKTFLENNDYYDITVKVGEKMYKLHRPVLKSVSSYFNELFSKEYSELAEKSEGIPTLPSKEKVYTIDDIDSTAFDLVVDHLYSGKVEPTKEIVIPLLKAAHLLKINSLKKSCSRWMRVNYDQMNTKDVVEILNFTHENPEYKNLNRLFVSEYILSSERKTFLKNNDYYDVTVKVGEKMYKLHRPVLKSESLYFNELFSKEYSELDTESEEEYSELDTESEGIPTLPSKDKVYTIDDIDSTIFDMVVDHMYSGKVEPSQEIALPLLKAAQLLKISSLKKSCSRWMEENYDRLKPKDVIETLNFTHEKTDYADLNRFLLSKYIVDSWPRIAKLPQFADLFNAIVLPEGADSCENGVYLFDKVDQETFKTIIDHVYFNKVELRDNNLARVLRASDMFKIENLIKECVRDLLRWKGRMSAADIKEVLNVTMTNVEYYEVLNTVYLAEYMKQWPEVDIDFFCTISDDCLEDMLLSQNLHFDDPRVLLDICSKWVMHDVENRYSLIPRITLAISRNRKANCDDYSIMNPPDWKECSQDFVKEKIRDVLSSTSVLPAQSLSEDEIKKREIELPVFITSKKGRSFSVLNADWEEIVSFRLGENIRELTSWCYYPMSATIMNDNLFILCCMRGSSFFYVYNFSSEKIFFLASDPRIFKNDKEYFSTIKEFTLLNCCNDIYCCHEDGQILKYLSEFNRWMRISVPEPERSGIRYASDGDKLFRMMEMSRTDTETNYTIDVYDFEQNLWISTPFPSLTLPHHESCKKSDDDRKLQEFVFLNNHGLAALFRKRLLIFNQETRLWQNINSLPRKYEFVRGNHEIINRNQADEVLYVRVNKLYKFSPANKSWELRKEWPMKTVKDFTYLKHPPYGNIIGIHNPKPSRLFHIRGFTSLAPGSRPLFTRAVRLGGHLRGSHFQSAPARALVSLGLIARGFF